MEFLTAPLAALTLPVLWSNQTRAWFLERTLQSKVALFWAGRQRATDLPILTGSSRYTCRSWNGCELGRQANTASAEGIDFGLRVLLQPDTRDRFSWSRVAGFCSNPQKENNLIYVWPKCRQSGSSSWALGTNWQTLSTVHSTGCTAFPPRFKKTHVCLRSVEIKKTKPTGIKKTRHSLPWRSTKSYITKLTSDSSRHYVQTGLPCVKTYVTEYSSDSLATSLPRPSNYSSTGEGEGSQSAAANPYS